MENSSSFTTLLHAKLERMRRGDREARDELLRATGVRLEKLARKMLRAYPVVQRWAEADDVLQNALLRLLRALETIEPASTRAFFNLAAVQIRRELIDLARHFSGPHGIAPHHESIAAHDLPNPLPAEDQGFECWAAFHEEVDRLPAEEREVISLIFYHGWKQQDVAELFAVNVRTVRRWWQAALVRLQTRFKEFRFA